MRRGTLVFIFVLVTTLTLSLAMGGCATQSGSPSPSGESASPNSISASSADGSVDAGSASAPSGSEPASSVGAGSAQQAAISPNSILLFDGNEKSAKLVADMDAGITPAECTVLYDQMGALPSVTVTDEKTIAEIYNRLAQVTVAGESQYSITDNYHSVSFVLQDGTRVGFSFEGEWLLSRGGTNYAVEGSGPLWACVRTLQAGITSGKNVYAIYVQDDAGVLLDCPLTAEEGEIVRLVCSTETSENVHVFVNGEDLGRGSEIYVTVGGSEERTPAHAKKFEFFMPASDVELVVTVGS